MQRNSKSVQDLRRAQSEQRSIVLIGMMGVGKSTIGRRLAARLGLPFVDADDEIIHAAGMSIPEIFEKYGESGFRDGERRVIARLIEEGRQVIATGGGAFMNEQTRDLLLEQALTIWLDADVDILVERVGRREGRPLLQGKDPKAVLTELSALRNPYYALAPLRVKSGNGPHDQTVDRIMEALKA
ncbi:MAG: shikimate kinase [Sphingobium sp.]|nr:shikimate kinase [Sphingobium sp.]